jgi:two-component system, cell cycle sensor histidine kinase and response regulator CckA
MLWLYLTALLPVVFLLVVFLNDVRRVRLPKPIFTPLGKTILLVDDDPKMCDITGRKLKGQGFTVLVAPDGETALKLAQAHPGPIDLLVTDVIMPGMSGPLLAKYLQDIQPLTPVLYISGMADVETLTRETEPRIEFLVKPFTGDTLARKIGHVLGARGFAA